MDKNEALRSKILIKLERICRRMELDCGRLLKLNAQLVAVNTKESRETPSHPYDDNGVLRCPLCHISIDSDSAYDHCPFCLQKFNWSEGEEGSPHHIDDPVEITKAMLDTIVDDCAKNWR